MKIKLIDFGYKQAPNRAHENDAGADVFAMKDFYLLPQTTTKVPLGFGLEVPDGYETTFQYFYGYQVDQVRNLIADWVIKGYDYLFAVDHDISFPTDTLKKLLSHDKDLVSGVYIQRNPHDHIIELYDHTGRITIDRLGNGIIPIKACGFGCVLVKKHVFESVGYPQFRYHDALDHKDTFSEDHDFCKKAIEKGFKLFADTTVRCDHTGSFTHKV